jgi:hypothetical protein
VVKLDELSKRLGIDPGTLESMVDFLVRRGYLANQVEPAESPICENGQTCSSGYACPGPAECPFMIHLPKIYTLSFQQEPQEEE